MHHSSIKKCFIFYSTHLLRSTNAVFSVQTLCMCNFFQILISSFCGYCCDVAFRVNLIFLTFCRACRQRWLSYVVRYTKLITPLLAPSFILDVSLIHIVLLIRSIFLGENRTRTPQYKLIPTPLAPYTHQSFVSRPWRGGVMVLLHTVLRYFFDYPPPSFSALYKPATVGKKI